MRREDNVNLIIEIPNKCTEVVSHPFPCTKILVTFYEFVISRVAFFIAFQVIKSDNKVSKINCFPIDIKLKNVVL